MAGDIPGVGPISGPPAGCASAPDGLTWSSRPVEACSRDNGAPKGRRAGCRAPGLQCYLVPLTEASVQPSLQSCDGCTSVVPGHWVSS